MTSAKTPAKRRRARRRRYRENAEIAAFVRRMFRAMIERVGTGDESDLAEMIELQHDLDAAIRAAVQMLHYEQGFSWTAIGEATGATKQAAQQRWGRR